MTRPRTVRPHLGVSRLSDFFLIFVCELRSPVTESNRRPSPYHLGASGSLKVVGAAQRLSSVSSSRRRSMRLLHSAAARLALIDCHRARGSSSRSRVVLPTASATACPTWAGPSVRVRWRPLQALAIATQLVTRFARESPSALMIPVAVLKLLPIGDGKRKVRASESLRLGGRTRAIPAVHVDFASRAPRGDGLAIEYREMSDREVIR